MRISIIIPVYNAEDFLDECIKSALNQTYKNIEVIAINDGSTDNSLNILKKYADRIKIITKENGGTASALNIGIQHMTGEWFKWLGNDDILYENAVETLVNEIISFRGEPKACIFYTHYETMDFSGRKIGEFVEPNYNGLTNFEKNVILLDHHVGNANSSLIHRSIFDKCGRFSSEVKFREDYEFWLRCCLLYGYTIHLIPKFTLKYRIHQRQLTKLNMIDSLERTTNVRNLILGKLEPSIQEKYLEALNEYRKKKPLITRGRRMIRDGMFRFLPKSISSRVLKTYLNLKE
ncbi:MAG: glycosyltransferase [Thaumarchaeota archaeon]|nr:glycosyltransferase [Nitrososphaerota archaeon]MDE1842333.1 glycosyltransferase [Nitrososphaerota archaeon]